MTAEAKKLTHTPGPWECGDRGSYGIDIRTKHAPLGKWIATANSDHGDSTYFPTNEEMEANARLIAAAPDMLEAAKRAGAVLAEIAKGNGQHSDEAMAALSFVHNAIAKAEPK